MDKPIWEYLYARPERYELVRAVGYFGTTMVELARLCRELPYERGRLLQAAYALFAFEGQITEDGKGRVELRPEVRKVSHQLLGPEPDTWDTFYRFSDGRPRPEHAAKMALLAKHRKPEPKRPRRKTG